MKKIVKLDTELINHIAAGEVVERPASILKELVENAIDAGAGKITIRVKKGGIELIEVIDDGIGISEEDLLVATDSHSTSKVSSIDDLSKIATLGFRGEALASITAVSKAKITTATEEDDHGHMLKVEGGKKEDIAPATRETGTTVEVRKIFYNVPARRKFLKTPRTEYRKLVEVFFPIALIHPEIHFVYESEGRKIYTLPAVSDSSPGTLHPQRVKELFSGIDFIEVFFDGNGMQVGGFVGHPEFQSSRSKNRYVFVNGRPIWDNGVAKAVMVGTSRFVPEGAKLPFLISLSLPYEQVDVNVHPQKSEVRFANPYRVYSAVEAAVKNAYEENVGREGVGDISKRFRTDEVVSHIQDESGHGRGSEKKKFEDGSAVSAQFGVKKSLEFSKMLLEDAADSKESDRTKDHTQDEQSRTFEDLTVEEYVPARQFLNRYIVAQMGESLLLIDQHAAAERIRFEKLLRDYGGDGVESQSLMLPVTVELAETEALFVEETNDVFERLGYLLNVKKGNVYLNSVPAILVSADQESLFRSILDDLQEFDELDDKTKILKDTYRDSVIATMACHTSVRMSQRLNDKEASRLVKDLFSCKNSYSCPHGRPIVWRLTQEDIDRHFAR